MVRNGKKEEEKEEKKVFGKATWFLDVGVANQWLVVLLLATLLLFNYINPFICLYNNANDDDVVILSEMHMVRALYTQCLYSFSHNVLHGITEDNEYVVPLYTNIRICTFSTLEHMHNLSHESKAKRNDSRNLSHRETSRPAYLPLLIYLHLHFAIIFCVFSFIFQLYVFKHHDTRSTRVRHTISIYSSIEMA